MRWAEPALGGTALAFAQDPKFPPDHPPHLILCALSHPLVRQSGVASATWTSEPKKFRELVRELSMVAVLRGTLDLACEEGCPPMVRPRGSGCERKIGLILGGGGGGGGAGFGPAWSWRGRARDDPDG